MNTVRHQGYILLPVMLAVALVAAIAFMMNHEGATNIRTVSNDLEGARAQYVAQAGLAHARWQAAQQGCGPFTDLTAQVLSGDSYTTALTTDLGSTTSYTITVDQDTWIDSARPTDTHGGDNRLNIRFQGGVSERPVFRFDLSPVAADADILAATAWFYVTGQHPEGAIDIHRVTADWTEVDATWESIGDRMESVVLATIPPVDKDGTWVAVNLTGQVQAWVNGQPNYGIMLTTAAEGVQGDYAPREHSTRPYLQLVVGTPPSSPAALQSVGTLASGLSRTLTRGDVTLLQQPASIAYLQPDASEGKDTYLYEWKQTWNYGGSNTIWVENRYANSIATGLLSFDLTVIPHGARVVSAALELYQTNASLAGGQIGVHRISSDWTEGSQDGGMGSPNWTQRDGGSAWSSPGGDYDVASAATTTVPPGKGWSAWDITGLVGDWVSGAADNRGLALVAESFGTAAHFASSDAADPTLRPKLTVSYSCTCGDTCLAPQGSGELWMVVINPTTLVAADAYKKALFESWGYTVGVIGESENQAAYDNMAATADVVFISETVNASQVGSRLKDMSIGVVSQDGSYNSALGIASGASWAVGSATDVTDTSHYITAPFRTGPLRIYAGVMEQLRVSGTLAPGLQTLADTGGTGSLVVLDKGVTTTGGGTAAGRRVMLPLGREGKFNWDYLNSNGRLLVQRALQWGTGNTGEAPARQLLFVSGGSVVTQFPSGNTLVLPTAQEQLRIDLIESWGYAVTLIHVSESQANFDTAVAASDVAYVSSSVSDLALGTKLKAAPIGVVNENMPLAQTFGFASDYQTKSRDEIRVLDNTHYITSPFATGYMPIFTSLQTVYQRGSANGAVATKLADSFNTGTDANNKPSLLAIDPGNALSGGGTAAGRRVQLPWGANSFDVAALNADGQTIMQRAIEWAEGRGDTSASKVLLVVGDAAAPSSADIDRMALIESWGYPVALIDDESSQASFDVALATADAAYVSETTVYASLGTKLKSTTIGVVNEDPDQHSVFGFSGIRYLATGNAPMKVDTTHYITASVSAELVTLFSSNQPIGAAVGTLPPGLVTIGQWTSGTLSSLGGLLTLETGATIADGSSATGRRVQLPWGGQDGVSVTDIGALSADGQTIMQRAIEWAMGADAGGGGSPPSPPVFEAFTEASLGSDGTSLTIARPAGTAAGDLLIAALVTDGDTAKSMTPPAGWTELYADRSSKQVSLGVWWKLAGASEGADYTFGWTRNEQAYGWIMRFTGHDPAAPIQASALDLGASAAPPAPSVTTTTGNALIVRLGGFDDDYINAGDPGLAGHTAINMGDSGNGNTTVSGGSGYLVQPAAGASAAANFALTASQEFVTVTVAIAPAP